MNYYQLTYLLSGELSQEKAKEKNEQIISSLQEKEKIVVIKSDSPAKKTLSYPVKDQKIAYMSEATFCLKPNYLDNLRKKLKQQKDVLRFILEKKKPKKKTTPKRTRQSLSKEAIKEKTSKETATEKTSSKKPGEEKDRSKLKEIEDKLNEILGK